MSVLDALGDMLPPLLVIVGALLLLRRFAQRGRAGTDTGIRVLARTGVTRSAVVAVVQVAERRFLLGAGDAGVRLLAELPAADPGDPLHPAHPRNPGAHQALLASNDERADEAQLRSTPLPDRPRMGLYRQLQTLTVRTRLRGSSDAPLR